jgi:peptidoglycan/xylan/chitin deacetylase (PgdA/CDA1 family)
MRRAIRYAATIVALLIALGANAIPTASAAIGDELLTNPGLEAPDSSGTAPAFWSASTWGNPGFPASTVTFTWPADAHGGAHSARVDVTSYTDGGDSKWVPDAIEVQGGSYYTFSDWYQSNANTAVSIYYELATDTDTNGDGIIDGHWANLFSGIAPADHWSQYKTGFTMPDGALRAQFVHFIVGPGYLQTDDYSVKETAAPPGFSRPMISLTFDDGSRGFYDTALPILDEKAFKTTQYIPTYGLTTNPPDAFMMTKQEIGSLAQAGHEIGSHSVRHPDLTTSTDSELSAELTNSKLLLDSIAGVGTIHTFAYPFGAYDARVIAAADAAGYSSARSVEEGYNSKLDLQLYDIRVQNMLPTTTMEQFRSWVDYAKAHNYWLVIVYHEVIADGAPRCTNTETDPDPCLGDYDTTVTRFGDQLDYIAAQGLAGDVKTVQDALDAALSAGTPTPTPAPSPDPTSTLTPTPMPSPAATPPPTATLALTSDRLAPKITVTSPKARTYRAGHRLRIAFACRDSSGVARYKATLRRVGGKARTVRKGTTVRLSRAGAYVLRVTATDRKGNTASKTVRFRVGRR